MKRLFNLSSAAIGFGFFFWLLTAFFITQWSLAFWPFEKSEPAAVIEFPSAQVGAKTQGDLEDIQKMLAGQANPERQDKDAAPTPSPLETRLQLKGIARSGTQGVALLAVDGQPSKPFAIGKEVLPGVQVTKIQTDKVYLSLQENPGDKEAVVLALPKKP